MPMGTDLAELRARAGLSIREVARRADLTPSSLSEIERLKRDPRWSTVERVASALGATIVFYAAPKETTEHE